MYAKRIENTKAYWPLSEALHTTNNALVSKARRVLVNSKGVGEIVLVSSYKAISNRPKPNHSAGTRQRVLRGLDTLSSSAQVYAKDKEAVLPLCWKALEYHKMERICLQHMRARVLPPKFKFVASAFSSGTPSCSTVKLVQ